MGLRDYIGGIWRAVRGRETVMPPEVKERWTTEAGRYETLRAYRSSEDLYGRLSRELQHRGYAGFKDLRNPAHALAELYAYKLPEGTLENLECPDELRDMIKRIYEDGNLKDREEVASRDYAVTGDLFWKAANTEDRAWPQWIDPSHVTEYDEDERGFATFARFDIPQSRRDGDGELETFTETEVYDKERAYHAVIEHDGGPDTPLSDLLKDGNTKAEITLYEELQENPEGEGDYSGVDFIPIVHRKLRDTGAERGEGAYQHALSAIDETNEMATRLNAMLFPETLWALTRPAGPGGEALPPIVLEDEDPESRIARLEQERQKVVEVGNQKMVRLPGGANLTPLVPDVKIDAHANALAAQVKYVEEHLLPELQYRSLKDQGQLSGRAAVIYLADATDRLGGARRKYDDGLVRCIQMCLTLRAVMGMEGSENIPAYEDRKDQIRIAEREVFPVSELDKLDEDVKEAGVRQTYKDMGLLRFRLEEEGRSEEDIAKILASVEAAQPTDLPSIFGVSNLTQ